MVLEKLKGQTGVRLDLGTSLDLQTAGELTDLLREAVGQPGPLMIDASTIERMSTSGIQALLAACRAMAAVGGETKLIDPSSSFFAAFADCGLRANDMGWTIATGTADG